jgi:membrane protein YqaA with SNARE-associated domain
MPSQTTYELIGLAVSAFASATLLPGGSEAVFAGILAVGQSPFWLALAVACVANTAGSCANWGIGRYLAHWRHHPRFPVSADTLDRTADLFRRRGIWLLLFCWVPIVGDPMTVVAGVLRTPFVLFLVLVAVAKTGRYLAIAGVVSLF